MTQNRLGRDGSMTILSNENLNNVEVDSFQVQVQLSSSTSPDPTWREKQKLSLLRTYLPFMMELQHCVSFMEENIFELSIFLQTLIQQSLTLKLIPVWTTFKTISHRGFFNSHGESWNHIFVSISHIEHKSIFKNSLSFKNSRHILFRYILCPLIMHY